MFGQTTRLDCRPRRRSDRDSSSWCDGRHDEPELAGEARDHDLFRGAYRFPALPPGSYRVRATLPGFRPVEKAATVALDAVATVDLKLQISAEEQVVVTGEAPLIDSTSTTTGTNYTNSVISHLPVSRNYADIVKSNPGVSTDEVPRRAVLSP